MKTLQIDGQSYFQIYNIVWIFYVDMYINLTHPTLQTGFECPSWASDSHGHQEKEKRGAAEETQQMGLYKITIVIVAIE